MIPSQARTMARPQRSRTALTRVKFAARIPRMDPMEAALTCGVCSNVIFDAVIRPSGCG